MVVAPQRPTAAPAKPWPTSAHRAPRVDLVVRWLPTALAVLVFAAEYQRIRQWWFIPGRYTSGYPAGVAYRTLDGVARAPDQYRVLAAYTADAIAELLGKPLPTGMVVLDVASIVGTVLLLHVLCTRAGAPWLILAAAGGWAFWASRLDHWDANVAPLTLVVAAVAVVLQRPGRCAPVWLLALGAAACGLRPDYGAGLGAILAVYGLARRRWLLATTGVVLSAGSQAAALALIEAFPRAHYESAVLQLDYNFTPGALAAVVSFYTPALLPIALLLARRMPVPMWWAPAWFVLELAVTFVVGRPDETRIFLPFVPVLAIAAGLACLELVRSGRNIRRN